MATSATSKHLPHYRRRGMHGAHRCHQLYFAARIARHAGERGIMVGPVEAAQLVERHFSKLYFSDHLHDREIRRSVAPWSFDPFACWGTFGRARVTFSASGEGLQRLGVRDTVPSPAAAQAGAA